MGSSLGESVPATMSPPARGGHLTTHASYACLHKDVPPADAAGKRPLRRQALDLRPRRQQVSDFDSVSRLET